MHFTPVQNFCEENVWQYLQSPSEGKRWAVMVLPVQGGCTFHAQISQFEGPEPVIWDYHVVALEQSANGLMLWDPDCSEGSQLQATLWTQLNFPSFDANVRMRVIEGAEYVREFKSDRRLTVSEMVPPWAPISIGEENLSEFRSLDGRAPGQVLDLNGWAEFLAEAAALPNPFLAEA